MPLCLYQKHTGYTHICWGCRPEFNARFLVCAVGKTADSVSDPECNVAEPNTGAWRLAVTGSDCSPASVAVLFLSKAKCRSQHQLSTFRKCYRYYVSFLWILLWPLFNILGLQSCLNLLWVCEQSSAFFFSIILISLLFSSICELSMK